MAGVTTQTLGAEADGMRLDRWLRREHPAVTQGRIEKMCRKGEVRLDGGRVKASTRLAQGQTLRLPPMPQEAPPPPAAPKISTEDAALITSSILYEDDDLIALNKPPGLAAQGGSGTTRHVDGLAAALVPEGAPRPKLVHRLDRDTSGVMLLAKSAKSAAALSRAFQSRATTKLYWAAIAGTPQPSTGTIHLGLAKQPGHGPHGAGEKMVAIHPDDVAAAEGAKHATTDFIVLETAAKRAAWVALLPLTGRTHQLRVHMAALGHPIVGDGKYGTNAQENLGSGWGAQLGGSVSRKLHLHARQITIAHPASGAALTITAPLPRHMEETFALFDWRQSAHPGNPFEEARP